MNDLTNLEATSKALTEIEEAFFDIPFENSDYQNETFVLAAQITPERAYRALGLRMHSKLEALRSNYFSEKKRLINIGELEEKISSPDVSKWDKMRAQIEIDEINSGISFSEKLKNDTIRELKCLYKHFKALPQFTREQFELAERNHFEQRLMRNANGISGPTESLLNISRDVAALLSYEDNIKDKQDQLTNDTLSMLRLAMTNQAQTNP